MGHIIKQNLSSTNSGVFWKAKGWKRVKIPHLFSFFPCDTQRVSTRNARKKWKKRKKKNLPVLYIGWCCRRGAPISGTPHFKAITLHFIHIRLSKCRSIHHTHSQKLLFVFAWFVLLTGSVGFSLCICHTKETCQSRCWTTKLNPFFKCPFTLKFSNSKKPYLWRQANCTLV